MKIIKESKEKLPVDFLAGTISRSWDEVASLNAQIKGIKDTFKGAEKAAAVLQDLADAYLIAIGQLEALLSKNGIEVAADDKLKESYTLNESDEAEAKPIEANYQDISIITDEIKNDLDLYEDALLVYTDRQDLGGIKYKLIKSVEAAENFEYHSDAWGEAEEYKEQNLYIVKKLAPYIGKVVVDTSAGYDNLVKLVGILIDVNYNAAENTQILAKEMPTNESLKESSPELAKPIEAKKFEDKNKTEIFTELPDYNVEVEQKGKKVEVEVEPKDEFDDSELAMSDADVAFVNEPFDDRFIFGDDTVVNEWPDATDDGADDIAAARAAIANGAISLGEPINNTIPAAKYIPAEEIEDDEPVVKINAGGKKVLTDDYFCDFDEPTFDNNEISADIANWRNNNR